MPVSRYLCIFLNVQLKSAAQRDVGTGANQIPDMSSFTGGSTTMAFYYRFPNGMVLMGEMHQTSPVVHQVTLCFFLFRFLTVAPV
ncbi:hypothetical protein AML55_15500 [Escherichia coli]|nr:hypothetical protein AB22_3599 [Escherichia coli 6-175-07_S1_C1]KYR41686.1 hypothetical protein AML05_08770 [Escherichia coli]KYR63294.1 hypothetical protein AML08_03500 [Escherichia coli]KYR85739.1 hypothetical protein AML13_05180 [Escherichia coli]KYT25653.1 hypothetical protein AML46_07680 [Escherichia coli]